MIKQIATFLHLIDEDGQLDLTDIAFMIIMGKIVVAAALDWPSVVTLATVCINKMHRRTTGSSDEDLTAAVQDTREQVKTVVDKINEVLK